MKTEISNLTWTLLVSAFKVLHNQTVVIFASKMYSVSEFLYHFLYAIQDCFITRIAHDDNHLMGSFKNQTVLKIDIFMLEHCYIVTIYNNITHTKYICYFFSCFLFVHSIHIYKTTIQYMHDLNFVHIATKWNIEPLIIIIMHQISELRPYWVYYNKLIHYHHLEKNIEYIRIPLFMTYHTINY